MFVNFYMHRILLFILLATSLFAREYIAVIDFEGIGVSEDDAKALTQRLTSELINLEIYQVVERAEMKRLLDEQKFQYSGCVSTKCAVQIGMMIGAKYMVVGSISKLGSSFSVDSRLLNVETSEAYYSGSYTHKGEIDGLLSIGMKSIAHQLCGMPFDKTSTATNNLSGSNQVYNSTNTQDVFPYFSELSKQLEYEKKRIYIEEDKGQKQIVSGGGSKKEIANPFGVILLDEKADYISVSKPVTTKYEDYHIFKIFQGKRQLNEFEFMEIIGFNDEVKEAKKQYRQELKRYNSFVATSHYKDVTKKLSDVQPISGIIYISKIGGITGVFMEVWAAITPIGSLEGRFLKYGLGLFAISIGVSYLTNFEIGTERVFDYTTTNPYKKPEMKQVLTTEQIKSLAESYNRKIYKEIQGTN